MKKVLLPIFFLLTLVPAFADEGMWLPQLLQQLNAPEMRLKGLQIPVEEIYSVNKNSLKDAVVLFGAGCTGELISDKGLLLTNHHCGFSQIQDHSSLEHNYLKDGFWAMTPEEELTCPGLTVTFIVSILDVTPEFSAVLTEDMTETQRNDKIKEIASRIEKKAMEGTSYEAKVRQFFSGNQFYMITSETFKDIRMVGAPPSSIGNFGGDTDNWMWPRHTGDFSMFRIYANKDNQPADYSKDNVPYHPKHFFPISIAGVKENDFTMVYGFPGRTQEYISSYALNALINITNPDRVHVRDERLRIIDDAMRSSEQKHIQYAAKQKTISNGWKKWKGETKGILLSNGVQKKRDFEKELQTWAEKTPTGKLKYGNLLPQFSDLYAKNSLYMKANDYYAEAAFGIEVINYANAFRPLADLCAAPSPDAQKITDEAAKLKKGAAGYFKNYDVSTDQKMMSSLLLLFDTNIPDSLKPVYFTDLRNRYKNNFDKMAESVFRKTNFTSSEKVDKMLSDFTAGSARKFTKDPVFQLADQLSVFYKAQVTDKITTMNTALIKLNRLYMAAQMEMQPEKKFYPDANSTLRLAYGQVKGYSPRDGDYYTPFSTLDGIMEKYIPGDEDFDVPAKLVELYKSKNYGNYAVNGTMPVAFLATNHTTGGNSGSPVLNAKGQLIGTNFDRVWEGTMSDEQFNPDICRNITLDIRYTLFIIDKFAGDKRLIDEMDIIR
jgi:hypothetical protein